MTKKLSETFADEPDPLIVEVRNKVADLIEAEVSQIEEARAETTSRWTSQQATRGLKLFSHHLALCYQAMMKT